MTVFMEGRELSQEVIEKMYMHIEQMDQWIAEAETPETSLTDMPLLEFLKMALSHAQHSEDEQAALGAILFGDVLQDFTAPLRQRLR